MQDRILFRQWNSLFIFSQFHLFAFVLLIQRFCIIFITIIFVYTQISFVCIISCETGVTWRLGDCIECFTKIRERPVNGPDVCNGQFRKQELFRRLIHLKEWSFQGSRLITSVLIKNCLLAFLFKVDFAKFCRYLTNRFSNKTGYFRNFWALNDLKSNKI